MRGSTVAVLLGLFMAVTMATPSSISKEGELTTEMLDDISNAVPSRQPVAHAKMLIAEAQICPA
jgi:hypothetical protein